MRLIDADALLDKQECLFMKRHILFHGVTAYTIESAPTIDPETLPIVKELREQLARVTTERDKALRHEHLDELKLCLESSRDINLVYIPRLLAEKVAAESMNLENALSKVTAERDAAVSEIETIMAYGTHYPDTCQFCKNAQCCARGGTKPCLPKWRGIQEDQEDE